MKRCPFCAEEIQEAAIVCKHCGRDPSGPAATKIVSPLTAPLGCLGVVFLGLFLVGWCVTLIPKRSPAVPLPVRSGNVSALPKPPEPSPSPDLLALIAARGYESESGNYWFVEGRVKNIGPDSLKNVAAAVEWYDKAGTFITSDSALIEYNPLLPGQTSPFKTITRGNPVMSRFTVSFKRIFGGAISMRDDRTNRKGR